MLSGRPPYMASGLVDLQKKILLPPRYPKAMSAETINFINCLLQVEPKDRISFKDLWSHPYIKDEKKKFQDKKNAIQMEKEKAKLAEKQKKEEEERKIKEEMEKQQKEEEEKQKMKKKETEENSSLQWGKEDLKKLALKNEKSENSVKKEELRAAKRKNSYFALTKSEKSKIVEILRSWETNQGSKTKLKFECSFKKHSRVLKGETIVARFGSNMFNFSILPFKGDEKLQKKLSKLEIDAKTAHAIAECGLYRSTNRFPQEAVCCFVLSLKILYHCLESAAKLPFEEDFLRFHCTMLWIRSLFCEVFETCQSERKLFQTVSSTMINNNSSILSTKKKEPENTQNNSIHVAQTITNIEILNEKDEKDDEKDELWSDSEDDDDLFTLDVHQNETVFPQKILCDCFLMVAKEAFYIFEKNSQKENLFEKSRLILEFLLETSYFVSNMRDAALINRVFVLIF